MRTQAWRRGIPTLRLAYATRDQLSHGYAEINHNALWVTAHDAAPRMVAAARALLQSRR